MTQGEFYMIRNRAFAAIRRAEADMQPMPPHIQEMYGSYLWMVKTAEKFDWDFIVGLNRTAHIVRMQTEPRTPLAEGIMASANHYLELFRKENPDFKEP